ncbi:hypothetical protein [Phenylobacterium montanum]|uniref:Uncharacterized protein n=1 Tax=Phenylobacterium montanum TaxID=2823693 RepID=A0A975G3P0_9CAUL|nr:hypothetical protein [Caulobacter sp. S6]QUD90553.1 hypothetical protein KCG34_12125 [Caulobacter sp. S6]
MADREDQFEVWLMDMGDALRRFTASVPNELAENLDYSLGSLDQLEQYALKLYPDIDAAKRAGEAARLDGFSRYIGQTFRRSLGGEWFIDFGDAKNVFHGLPQLIGLSGQRTQICPLTMATAALDRRSGTYWSTILKNHLARITASG